MLGKSSRVCVCVRYLERHVLCGDGCWGSAKYEATVELASRHAKFMHDALRSSHGFVYVSQLEEGYTDDVLLTGVDGLGFCCFCLRQKC